MGSDGSAESILKQALSRRIASGKHRFWQTSAIMGVIADMAMIHISEARAAEDFAGLMACVRAGVEVGIASDARAVAVVRPAGDEFRPRLLSGSIALAKKHTEELGCEPRMDTEFAADLEEIIRNRTPWNPPAWESSSTPVS